MEFFDGHRTSAESIELYARPTLLLSRRVHAQALGYFLQGGGEGMIYGAAEIIDNRIPLIFCVIFNQHLSKAEAPMYWTLVQYIGGLLRVPRAMLDARGWLFRRFRCCAPDQNT